MRRRDFLIAVSAFASSAAAPPTPDFEFVGNTGTKESVSKYRGKTVALYFFNPG
jgi:peroxiredoxin